MNQHNRCNHKQNLQMELAQNSYQKTKLNPVEMHAATAYGINCMKSAPCWGGALLICASQ